MKIIVIDNATSSAVVCQAHGDGDSEYMGGPEIRSQIEDADVVVGAFCGDLIVLRAPANVEVTQLRISWKDHKRVQRLQPSKSEEQFAREQEPSFAHLRRDSQ